VKSCQGLGLPLPNRMPFGDCSGVTMLKAFLSRVTGLVVAAALVLASLVAVVWFYGIQHSGFEWVGHTTQVQAQLYRLLGRLDDTETGARGYLLTGDDSYLRPYVIANGAIEQDFRSLGALTADNPRQQQSLLSLGHYMTEHALLLKSQIDLFGAGNKDRALASMRGGSSKAAMDRMRYIFAQMIAEEEGLLGQRQRALDRATDLFLAGVLLAFASVIALAALAIANERRQKLTLTTSRNELAAANEKLVQEAAQRELVEQQLRQSQKLDAIGQLTGGIAHDFNNILFVIMGNVEVLAEKAGIDPEMRKHLDNILVSTERAADLTRQLLAFARKQPLRPQPTNLNDIVGATHTMLGRALGQHIEISAILDDGLWGASIDRAQFEAALVNLCINARDAMPEGGRLLIETQNVSLDEEYVKHNPGARAGDYAMLAVSDTGAGIPADMMERVFEPFVTTKAPGKGTGLGLSMVYGFIKQSHGHIKIYSEVGHGTTVRIYLPRNDEVSTEVETASKAMPRGTERILVVEDDYRVRENVVFQLGSLGYVVGQADSAVAGLARLTEDLPYDLLLTDVVMPGKMNGRGLADEARRRHADLGVLFMSGYTENAIVHNGHLDVGSRLLSKPFRKAELARAVRDAIDAN
jgi:signal transduction histidine kinase/ActR/RegA family two-component response regulator